MVLILTFLLMSVAMALLGLGLMLGRGAIRGSCGGLNQIPGITSDCGGACRSGGTCPRRDKDRR